MTEQEARKRAKEIAIEMDSKYGGYADPSDPEFESPDVKAAAIEVYMQCWRDMVGGEPDGYMAVCNNEKYKHEAFFAGSAQMMTPIFLKPVTINVADKFLGWEFKPIKLLRVG